jgi:hypothetical protein
MVSFYFFLNMQWFFNLFILVKILFPAADAGPGAGETPSIEGWYQVIETDQPAIWDKHNFQLSFTSASNKTALMLSGFTNQGAGILGVLAGRGIQFPKQTVKVIPKGGDGTIEWSISMEANGKLHGKLLEINYKISSPAAIAGSGKICAEKIHQ